MSQAGMNNTSGGPLPPTVPTSFVADSGAAVPAANILNVPGGLTSQDVANGIKTFGSGNTLSVQLTNTVNTTTQTTDNVAHNVGTFLLSATSGTYLFDGYVIGYSKTNNLGASYRVRAAVRTTSGTATLIGITVEDAFAEGTMNNCVVSGAVVAPNSFAISITGNGDTIDWRVYFQYKFVDGTA